jgi:hypothetical protein
VQQALMNLHGKQVGNINADLPAELVRRFAVVVKPSVKQRPLRLRDVSADHIGRIVILQVSSIPATICIMHAAIMYIPYEGAGTQNQLVSICDRQR